MVAFGKGLLKRTKETFRGSGGPTPTARQRAGAGFAVPGRFSLGELVVMEAVGVDCVWVGYRGGSIQASDYSNTCNSNTITFTSIIDGGDGGGGNPGRAKNPLTVYIQYMLTSKLHSSTPTQIFMVHGQLQSHSSNPQSI